MGQGNDGQRNSISCPSSFHCPLFHCPLFLCPFPSPRRRFREAIAGRTDQRRAPQGTVPCSPASFFVQTSFTWPIRLRCAKPAPPVIENALADRSGQYAQRRKSNRPAAGAFHGPQCPRTNDGSNAAGVGQEFRFLASHLFLRRRGFLDTYNKPTSTSTKRHDYWSLTSYTSSG